MKCSDKLIAEALAIELEAAKQADALGYLARALTIATLPYRNVKGSVFTRKNGAFRLTMIAPPDIGLPYGAVPRLLMAWISSEAVRTKNRTLVLGPTLSGFMAELGLIPAGGRWGTIHRLRDQMARLFSCVICYGYSDTNADQGRNIVIAEEYKTWWDPKVPDQAVLWGSYVELGQKFFDDVTD